MIFKGKYLLMEVKPVPCIKSRFAQSDFIFICFFFLLEEAETSGYCLSLFFVF